MNNKCIGCFKNLSVESRFKIFEFIKQNKNVREADVVSYINLKQPTVSYHLHEMEASGLIKRVPEDNKVYFIVNKQCPHDGHKCIVH